MGDASFEDVQQEHNFDPMALEDAMKKLYVGSKCTKLVATILLMIICTIHGVINRFIGKFFTLLWHHLLLEPNCLPTNFYAAKVDTKAWIKL